jgi:site-specific recombinase XerD
MPRIGKHPYVSIYQRDGVWQAKWLKSRGQRGGKTVSIYARESLRSYGITSKAQARAWAERKSARIIEGLRDHAHDADIEARDWSEQFDLYQAHYVAERKHEPNAEKRGATMRAKHLADFERFTSKQVLLTTDLTLNILRDFRDHLAASDLAPSTKNRRMGQAKAFLAWMVERDIIAGDLTRMRAALKEFTIKAKLPRILSPDDISKLLAASWPRRGYSLAHATAIPLMLLSGFRPIDLRQFNISNVDLDAQIIRVLDGKAGAERFIPFRDSLTLSALLKFLIESRDPRILNDHGGLRKVINSPHFRRIVGYADIKPALLNDLRKTHVTAVASNGNYGEGDLSARFGHTTGISLAYYRSAKVFRRDGDTVEAWLGAEEALNAHVARLCG